MGTHGARSSLLILRLPPTIHGAAATANAEDLVLWNFQKLGSGAPKRLNRPLGIAPLLLVKICFALNSFSLIPDAAFWIRVLYVDDMERNWSFAVGRKGFEMDFRN